MADRDNYLRVTEVLYPFSGLSSIPQDIVRRAAERGTKVHKICEGIIQGLGEIGVEDETSGYVESFKKWWGQGHKVVECERRFWDDQYCFTGQVDLIIETPEGLAVADLKTSYKPSKTWEAQGCAYAYLASQAGFDIKKILFIHLKKNGDEPKIISYECDDDFFFACLVVYLHFFGK